MLLFVMKHVFIFPAVLAGILLLACPMSAQLDSLPEPEVVFYGSVNANADGNTLILDSGTLTWTFVPPSGESFDVVVELGQGPTSGSNASLPSGISYVMRIPVEKLVNGTTLQPSTLEATTAPVSYDRSGVEVDGVSYQIAFPLQPAGDALVFGESLRGKIERIDLALVLSAENDSDDDGMPDNYELANGLNPNDPGDALLDSDLDGTSNFEEFVLNTNPRDFQSNVSLKVVSVSNNSVTVEYGPVVSGVLFLIQHSPDLQQNAEETGWATVGSKTPIPAEEGTTLQFEHVQNPRPDAAFYRLSVDIPAPPQQ